MKISKSKQELARIISENGGWRDGAEFAAQGGNHGNVGFASVAPVRHGKIWDMAQGFAGKFLADEILPNWHQTILSRAEYFHLYPAPDADGWIKRDGNGIISIEYNKDKQEIVAPGELDANGWIEHDGKHEPEISKSGLTIWCKWSDGLEQSHEANMVDWIDDSDVRVVAYRLHKHEKSLGELCGEVKEENKHEHIDAKPTIEQLAADYRSAKDYAERKQKEADDAKGDADSKLKTLELAGEALGLLVSPITAKQDPELVITRFTGKFHSTKHGDRPSSLDAICDGCGQRFGTHVGFDCRP